MKRRLWTSLSLVVRQRPGDRLRGHSQCLLPEPLRELVRPREMRRWSRQRKPEMPTRQRTTAPGKQQRYRHRRSHTVLDLRVAVHRLLEVRDPEELRQVPRLTPGRESGQATIFVEP